MTIVTDRSYCGHDLQLDCQLQSVQSRFAFQLILHRVTLQHNPHSARKDDDASALCLPCPRHNRKCAVCTLVNRHLTKSTTRSAYTTYSASHTKNMEMQRPCRASQATFPVLALHIGRLYQTSTTNHPRPFIHQIERQTLHL